MQTITKYFPDSPEIVSSNPHPEVAILIQGPILGLRSASELEKSIAIYQRIFPESPIILSTWKGNSKSLDVDVPNLHVVESEDPGQSIPKNLDRQAVSTFAGLEKAKELNADFTLRSRTDQRIIAPSAIEDCLAVWGLAKSDSAIAVSSYGTGKYRLFGPTDQMQFGKTSALMQFWEGLPSLERHPVVNPDEDGQGHEWSLRALSVQEIRLCVRYLERNKQDVKWNWDSHSQLMAAFFPIINSLVIGHLQLSRPLNSVDHVSFRNSAIENLIEQHSTLEFWLGLRAGNGVTSIEPSILGAALKAKSAEQCMQYLSTPVYSNPQRE